MKFLVYKDIKINIWNTYSQYKGRVCAHYRFILTIYHPNHTTIYSNS